MTRLHRKPLRPFGYRLLNEAAGSGTGFALTRRLNGWAREVVWESHWSCKVAQGRRIAGIFPPRSGLVQVEIDRSSRHDACGRRGRAGQETTVRTSLYKTNFSPALDERAVEKSRENRSSRNHQRR